MIFYESFFPESKLSCAKFLNPFRMYLDKDQLPIASIMMYAAVGKRDRGTTLKRYGSRMMSTKTGGTCSIKVLFMV